MLGMRSGRQKGFQGSNSAGVHGELMIIQPFCFALAAVPRLLRLFERGAFTA